MARVQSRCACECRCDKGLGPGGLCCCDKRAARGWEPSESAREKTELTSDGAPAGNDGALASNGSQDPHPAMHALHGPFKLSRSANVTAQPEGDGTIDGGFNRAALGVSCGDDPEPCTKTPEAEAASPSPGLVPTMADASNRRDASASRQVVAVVPVAPETFDLLDSDQPELLENAPGDFGSWTGERIARCPAARGSALLSSLLPPSAAKATISAAAEPGDNGPSLSESTWPTPSMGGGSLSLSERCGPSGQSTAPSSPGIDARLEKVESGAPVLLPFPHTTHEAEPRALGRVAPGAFDGASCALASTAPAALPLGAVCGAG